jgi:hypothetical protein
MFCREMVRDLRRVTASDPNYPRLLFFHLEDAATGRHFFERLWPEAPAVADPQRFFYTHFGLRRARLMELLGLRVLARAVQAVLKGNLPGRPTSDPLQMPGTVVVERNRVVWEHAFGHAGDHPDLVQLGRRFPRRAEAGESTNSHEAVRAQA